MKDELKERFSALSDLLTTSPEDITHLLEQEDLTPEDIWEIIDASMLRLKTHLDTHWGDLSDMDTSWVFPFAFTSIMNSHDVEEGMYKLEALINIDHEVTFDKIVKLFHVGVNMGIAVCIEMGLHGKPIIPPKEHDNGDTQASK